MSGYGSLVIDMVVAMNLLGLRAWPRRLCLRPEAPRRGLESRSKGRRRKGSFLADQRGAVAFETLIVYIFMVTALLLPLADVATAGFQFISAWEALRGFGQYVQYHPPADPTNTKLDAGAAHLGCGLSHQQRPGPLRQY